MKKRLVLLLAALMAALLLSGCGSLFDKEYVSVADYVPPAPNNVTGSGSIKVSDAMSLRRALQQLVYSAKTEGSISFDPNYDGTPLEDMERICWQLRTQDALFVYSVKDITYSIDKIVNYYEASVDISYSSYAAKIDDIIQLPYAVGFQDILREAMDENKTQIVLLVSASSYSVEKVKSLAQEIYRAHPTVCVREPVLSVYMYSGSGYQRLYEINFNYGLSENELIRCKSLLKNLDVRSNLGAYDMTDAQEALAACEYLVDNTTYSKRAKASCYDALIMHETDSEGLALAYVELCHQMELDCRIVYGQKNGESHCWNIIKLDDDYYHVDVSACMDGQYAKSFLSTDEMMWSEYRWNINTYPSCKGTLRYTNVKSE